MRAKREAVPFFLEDSECKWSTVILEGGPNPCSSSSACPFSRNSLALHFSVQVSQKSIPILCWRNQGPGVQHDLPKVTQPVSRIGSGTQSPGSGTISFPFSLVLL